MAAGPCGQGDRTGVIEGDTPSQVRQLLRERQLLPVRGHRSRCNGIPRANAILLLRRGMSPADLSLVTRSSPRCRSPAAAGGSPARRGRSRRITPRAQEHPARRAREGHGRAHACRRPGGLSARPSRNFIARTVAAGEQSGHLDAILDALPTTPIARHELRQHSPNAMIYPVALMVSHCDRQRSCSRRRTQSGRRVFDNTQAELPTLTRVLIAMSDFLRHYGYS